MELEEKKRKIVQFLLKENVLVDPQFLEELNTLEDPSKISELVNTLIKKQPSEQPKNHKRLETHPKRDSKVNILYSYQAEPKKIVAQDFITHFNNRYKAIKNILQQRIQLENAVSISRLKSKQERDTVSIIGIVSEANETKNGLMVTLEDPTGLIKVFFSKNKQQTMAKAKDIVLDEVIGISGSLGNNIVFANELYFPEVPLTKELKKSPEEEYVVFISDLHIGSTSFMREEFMRFITWIRGELGNEKQKALASKVKYLFVVGDAIDGISIYPTQKQNLSMHTFKEQYAELAKYLKQIPEDIPIILCPGQHDIVPLAEPQPPLPRDFSEELGSIPNLILVSNPSLINIAAKEGFPGFDVLMYHGGSYHQYAHNVESIRANQPLLSDRSQYVMRMLMQKRHLAPRYDWYPQMPTEKDHMIIDKIPDFLISGDVHKSAAFNYKGIITGIVGSCFQGNTDFQEKVGHTPNPGRVPIVNLKTRDVKILNFSGEQKDD